MRARKACAVPLCPHLQPCEDHPPAPAWEGSTRRSELPPGWSHRIVPRILRRDPVCTDGVVCGGLALSTEVHHTGDPHDHRETNLAGVCAACHTARTAQQAAAARGRLPTT